MQRRLILASGSPRRAFLLKKAGFTFEVIAPGTDEDFHTHLSPSELVLLHAKSKASAIANLHRDAVVVGSDTLVVLDGVPLGKPASMEEARRMLHRLGGREHHVCTGVGVVCRDVGVSAGFVDKTWVQFRSVDDDFIDAYFAKINPMDKAGAYAIQGSGAEIIEFIHGDPETVMGLPTGPLAKLLQPLLEKC